MKDGFSVPVVVFLFKRTKVVQIIDQIAKIRPHKLYLLGDGPRTEVEREEVDLCRKNVEQHITWDCEIIRNYALQNRGVYQNIACGAKWVFERESMAIFLEDDNFPSLSFFPYCQELLEKYRNDNRILWICGTNYMGKYEPQDGSDYVFTQLMLPCGWASWADKFNKFYDGEMQLYKDDYTKKRVRFEYSNKLLYDHDWPSWKRIAEDVANGKNPVSWDYQMAFSLRVHNLYGIAPKVNLIRNIGADADSIHGGTSMNNVMTARFCEVPIDDLTFPLRHPKVLMVDRGFETLTENIIILPWQYRFKGFVIRCIKKILFIDERTSLREILRRRRK